MQLACSETMNTKLYAVLNYFGLATYQGCSPLELSQVDNELISQLTKNLTVNYLND